MSEQTKAQRIAAARAALATRNTSLVVDRYAARMTRLAAVRSRAGEEFAPAKWCILRTSARQTIRLADTLGEAGIDAWTPQILVKRRTSRHRPPVERPEAIVSSFVFVPAHQLADVVRALSLVVGPHPQFSIFQQDARVPVIADRELAHFRRTEERSWAAHQEAAARAVRQAERATRRTMRADIAAGDTVRLAEGAYAGLSGVIEETSAGGATVCFNGTWRVAVASWLFVGAEVQQAA